MDVTILQTLSGDLIDKLGITTTTFLSAVDSLSGIPVHPYDRLVLEHFGPDYTFPTIDDVPLPIDFCLRTCIGKLTSINAQQKELHNAHYTQLSSIAVDNPLLGNAFATLSGDTFTVNNDQIKKYIEFHEIVKSIPVERINSLESVVISQKLLHCYTNIFN